MRKERRRYSTRLAWAALVVSILCFLAAAGIANTAMRENESAVAQHEITKSSVIDTRGLLTAAPATEPPPSLIYVLLWIIAGFIALAQGLVGYIYINGQKSTRSAITALAASTEKSTDELKTHIQDLYEKKMDTTVHDRVCAVLQHMGRMDKRHETEMGG